MALIQGVRIYALHIVLYVVLCCRRDTQSLLGAMSGTGSANNSWTILTPEVSSLCIEHWNTQALNKMLYLKKNYWSQFISFRLPKYEVCFLY